MFLRFHICLLLSLVSQACLSQLEKAGCFKSEGARHLLDSYVAAMGACDCQRTGVFLYDIPDCNSDPYQIDLEDNFDGDSLDASLWEYAPLRQGALAGEQRLGVYSPSNTEVSGGLCHMLTKKETVLRRAVQSLADDEILEDGNENLRSYNFTSPVIFSKKRFLYGKFEIRCSLPEGNGLWPAFWMYGGERANEIDIFDNYKGLKKLVTSIGHDFDGDHSPSSCSETMSGFDFSDWHTFGCTSEPDKIIFYVDDRPVRIIYRLLTSAREPVLCGDKIDAGAYFQLKSFPVEPMTLILTMPVISQNGPAESTPVDETTPFPSAFEIDYIKVWKRTPDPLLVYPNPTHGHTKLSTSGSQIKQILVRRMDGQLLVTAEINALETDLDLSMYSDGIYLISAHYDGGVWNKKIVKTSE